jgi:hypothetical protein
MVASVDTYINVLNEMNLREIISELNCRMGSFEGENKILGYCE